MTRPAPTAQASVSGAPIANASTCSQPSGACTIELIESVTTS
jgi:hypothetical protein